jgi:hypothetical protein
MSSGRGTSGAHDRRDHPRSLVERVGLPRSEPLRDPSCQWIDGNASRRRETGSDRSRIWDSCRASNLVSFQPLIDIFPVIQAATPNPNARNFRSDLPIESPKRDPTIPRRLFPCQQGRLESRCLDHSGSSGRGTNSRGFPSSRGQILGDLVAPWVFEPGPGFGPSCPGNAGRCPRATLSSCIRQYRQNV